MAKYSDYIQALEADDANPEGSGTIVIKRAIVSGFGTDGNYGGITLSLGVSGAGSNVSKASVALPKLSVWGMSGDRGRITLPKLTVSATRILSGTGFIAFKKLTVHSSGLEFIPGGEITFPMLRVNGWAGPAIKIFELCEDANYGL
jgi:hypothetical protein